jgi:hypothetical protein
MRNPTSRRAILLGLGLLAACQDVAPTSTVDHKDAQVTADGLAPGARHRLFVLDTVGFTRVGPQGVAPGFDLDGRVSGTDDATTCGHADFLSPEGKPGIDNTFATLVPLIEKTGISAVETLLQASIQSGGILLVLELDDLDSLVDDPAVKVTMRAGQGLPLLGTDGKLLTGQTFHLSPRDPKAHSGVASLVAGVVETPPFDLDLPVSVFGKDYTLATRGTRLRFRIVDAEHVEAGLLGTGITIDSVRAIAKTASEDQGGITDIVEGVIGGAGDLARDDQGVCQQVSAVLSFTGVSAFFYPADVTGTNAP